MRRFAFRLCLALGIPDPDALLASIPGELLVEWRAYASLEPFGPLEAYGRTASLQATLANIWRGKGRSPVKASDFMHDFERDVQPVKSPKEIYQTLRTGLMLMYKDTDEHVL